MFRTRTRPVLSVRTDNKPLTDDQIRNVVPAVFATQPHVTRSEKYCFIPTTELLRVAAENGFFPVQVSRSNTRKFDRREFNKHMIRCRRLEDISTTVHLNREIPEVVFLNAHDGSSATHAMAGIFQTICTNGLIVKSMDMGTIKVRHIGNKDFAQGVIDATFRVLNTAGEAIKELNHWKTIDLTPALRDDFGRSVKEIVKNDNMSLAELVKPSRPEYAQPTLANVFSSVQEKVMKGGVRGRTPRGTNVRTNPVREVGREVHLNQELWRLAKEAASLLTS